MADGHEVERPDPGLVRIAFVSDAVMAIAITLIVVQRMYKRRSETFPEEPEHPSHDLTLERLSLA